MAHPSRQYPTPSKNKNFKPKRACFAGKRHVFRDKLRSAAPPGEIDFFPRVLRVFSAFFLDPKFAIFGARTAKIRAVEVWGVFFSFHSLVGVCRV